MRGFPEPGIRICWGPMATDLTAAPDMYLTLQIQAAVPRKRFRRPHAHTHTRACARNGASPQPLTGAKIGW